jgi:hypothetical protein
LRDLNHFEEHIFKDYPFIHAARNRKFLLAIYPKWHTQLLPDSILRTEDFDVARDFAHQQHPQGLYLLHGRSGHALQETF